MARGTITLCLILGLLAAANAVPFDFFYLVLKWPGSSCTVSDGKCCVPKDGGYPAEDFLVESFQPFDVSINKPLVSCRNSEPFDIDKLDPIENSINNYWSNIACPPSSTVSTLKSAWKSYGVCSRLEQLDYFKAALELRTQADVLGALTDQGIMPVLDMYSLDKIKWAVKQKLGVTPGVLCNDGPFAKQHLDKVYICVDTDAKTFIECPKLPATTCTESIIFHPFYTWMLNGTFAYDSKIMLN
ncbi:hypothetical protein HU200_010459 [Digitaria exilis]|uniref:Uncharacterized protein n=1 Tax=Digitaria exilis TaxID=1010633 RepID=A0A835KRT6_9POAL|nr:hypothetical protein HU200_010459 [Digitaria exilis]CAB3457718.1 unnamed protein product [Digitaria exilis]